MPVRYLIFDLIFILVRVVGAEVEDADVISHDDEHVRFVRSGCPNAEQPAQGDQDAVFGFHGPGGF
jgi:hypothetical protein